MISRQIKQKRQKKKYKKTLKMKYKILFIFVFLIGLFLILWKAFLVVETKIALDLSPAATNLSSQATPHEISVPFPVPILMYHHIQDYPGNSNSILFVSPQNFESQMKWLSDNNFQTVSFDYLKNPTKLSGKPVILTFDDGYKDAFEIALPILEKYNFQATFYLIVDDINKPAYLTKDEILELKNDGMHFGSHTLSHPDLTTISEQQAEQEIYGSKTMLEQLIGSKISDFCFPGGVSDEEIENIVINSGYSTATTTASGINVGDIDPFKLNRLNILNDTKFQNLPGFANP